jgi:hypothetical protein
VRDAWDLKTGDKLRIIDASAFKPDCLWLQDEIVTVVNVTEVENGGPGYIEATHPKAEKIFLRPKNVELAEEK